MSPAIPATDTGQDAAPAPGGRRPTPWQMLGVGAGIVTESVASFLHPALGEVLAAADIIVPLAIGLILLTAILRGSDRTCERAFRLLRWITNRPEPPAPQWSLSRTGRKHQGLPRRR